jgi:putative transposase
MDGVTQRVLRGGRRPLVSQQQDVQHVRHLLTALSLGTRHWSCPTCGSWHNRDVNAAKNIDTAGGLLADACGGDVRHSGSSRVQSPAKQELPQATARTPVL